MELINSYKIIDNKIKTCLNMKGEEKLRAETHFPQLDDESATGAEKMNVYFREEAVNRNSFM